MKKILFLSLFIFININFAEAEKWEVTRGIKDIGLKAIAVSQKNPDVIYLGSKFIYKSEDGGKNWQQMFTVPAMASVNFLLVNENSVYAATENGLFKSDDAGKIWQKIFKGRDKENNVLCLDFDKQNNLIYIGTQRGLFKSADSESWQKSRGKLGNAEIYGVKTDPENANMIYVVSDEGFFKTDNQGKNWKKTFIISKLTREEEAESEEETEEQIDRLNDLAIGSELLYLVGKDILLKSADKGETWREMDKGILRGADIRSIVVADEIYVGTDRGVFKKAEDREQKTENRKEKESTKLIGQNWEEIYAGLPSVDVREIALAGDDLWAITGKGVFKRTEVTSHQVTSHQKKIEENLEQEVFELFVHEPSIREVQERAIKYAEVHPDKIKNWRRLSAKKAILPKFTVGVDGDKNRTLSDSIYGSSSQQTHYIAPDDKTVDDNLGWDVSLTWELGDLIWNDDQTSIDVRSRLMVQLREDILDEVTRTYFERKRLKIELFLSPPENGQKRIEKELRMEERTANLDALTGGWFSEEIKWRK